ncbi:hypothetical protein F5X97DRAFT_142653 [Nemania serpens]|nr:hypothetical protein F5X97DRAFT_142653 [Nemania serpens]
MASMGYYWPASVEVVGAGLVGFCRWLAATSFVTRRIDQWIETSKEEEAQKNAQSKSTSVPPSSSSPSPSASTSTSPTSPDAAPPATTSTQETRASFLRAMFEAFRQGTAPTVRESQLLTWEGWGFPLAEARHDKIVIWHGTEDGQSPIHMVRDLARRLPRCELRELEGETHFTLATYMERIMEELVPIDGDGDGDGDGGREGEGEKKIAT